MSIEEHKELVTTFGLDIICPICNVSVIKAAKRAEKPNGEIFLEAQCPYGWAYNDLLSKF